MPALGPGRRRVAALAVAGATLVGGGLFSLAPGQATASSHREAPLISGQPQYDNTDTYAFVSPDRPDTTTLIANWLPFEDPSGGPNFYKFANDARYEINVDSNGDSRPDYTFRWTFTDRYRSKDTFLYNTGPVTSLTDAHLNFLQTYDLTLIQPGHPDQTLAQNVPVAPSNVGQASMPDYRTLRQQALHPLTGGAGGWGNGGQVFAGQADDPFFLDLRVFDLLYGGNLSEVGNDTLRGYNVQSVALQVPSKMLAPSQPIVGIWADTQRRTASGWYTQVSRLGMPLVNEVVIPLKDKDKFNASVPANDAQFAQYVTDPSLPKVIQQVYKIPAPKTPRNDLVQVFLTGVPGLNRPPNVHPAEMLRLNTAIKPSKSPNRLGVIGGDQSGFPNGRRLTDDVVDASLQVVEGKLLDGKSNLGDGVNANDVPFETSFPYLAEPHSGSTVASASNSAPNRGGVEPNSGPSSTQLNAGQVSDSQPAHRSNPIVPIIGIGAGLALLAGGGTLWWTRRRAATR